MSDRRAEEIRAISRAELEAAIGGAFHGVVLGDGVSLRQAQVIDDYGRGMTEAQFRALPDQEVTNDWSAIPVTELESENIAHLDAEGLRYYLPAFMLRLLDDYGDGSEMWAIGTIGALDQRRGHPLGFLELLTTEQRQVIATYVRALPSIVQLDWEAAHSLERALRDVWSRYLPTGPDDGQLVPG